MYRSAAARTAVGSSGLLSGYSLDVQPLEIVERSLDKVHHCTAACLPKHRQVRELEEAWGNVCLVAFPRVFSVLGRSQSIGCRREFLNFSSESRSVSL